MAKTLILIPSRMAATRLPGKPLLKVNNLSMVSHVFKRAEEANIGEVVVATEDQEILEDVLRNGGKAVLTSNDHKTGTDRIFEAFQKLNIKNIDYILNLQGDEPNIDKSDIINLNNLMINSKSEIGTLAAIIQDDKMFNNKNVYHHLGVYSYKVNTLKKFVRLNQTDREKKNKLEQLRAIDNNWKINVALAKSSPIGVDTEEDYLAIKKIMEYKL